jgi:hypothetical protein
MGQKQMISTIHKPQTVTPGQAAYEDVCIQFRARRPRPPWDDLSEDLRAIWERRAAVLPSGGRLA